MQNISYWFFFIVLSETLTLVYELKSKTKYSFMHRILHFNVKYLHSI